MSNEKKSGIEEAAEIADMIARDGEESVKKMTKEELEKALLNQYKVTETYREAAAALVKAVRANLASLRQVVKNLPKDPEDIKGIRDVRAVQDLAEIINLSSDSIVTTIDGLKKTADAYSKIAGVLKDMYNTVFKNPGVWMEKEVYKKFQEEVFKKIGFDPTKEYNPEEKKFADFVVDYLKAVTLTGGDYKGECTRLAPIVETIQEKIKRHPKYEAAKKKVKQNARK